VEGSKSACKQERRQDRNACPQNTGQDFHGTLSASASTLPACRLSCLRLSLCCYRRRPPAAAPAAAGAAAVSLAPVLAAMTHHTCTCTHRHTNTNTNSRMVQQHGIEATGRGQAITSPSSRGAASVGCGSPATHEHLMAVCVSHCIWGSTLNRALSSSLQPWRHAAAAATVFGAGSAGTRKFLKGRTE
jgi:hypothetical protein